MLPLPKNASLADFWGCLKSPHFPHFAPRALDWCPSMIVAGEPALIRNHSPLPTFQWVNARESNDAKETLSDDDSLSPSLF